MFRRYMLIATLILMIMIICIPVGIGENIFEESRVPIPDNLPWYPIIVFGDNRPPNVQDLYPPPVYYDIINETKVINPVAIIGTGDHTGVGKEEQMDVFAESLKGLENAWIALGNHDLNYRKLGYWKNVIGPEYYYVDDIPGWRISVVNSDRYPKDRFLEQVYYVLNTTDRSIIFVFHRPLYPYVRHNINELGDGREHDLEVIISNRSNIKLVIQGHWHGYAVAKKGHVEYIVTGGAGAPLYDWPAVVRNATDVVKGKYHYIVLILYPNGTYEYYPISVTGEIVVKQLNETSSIILNNKTDIHGDPVNIPIRLKYEINGKTYYIVLMANNGVTIVNYKIIQNTVLFYTNSTKWYVYSPTSDPDVAEVYTDTEMLELWRSILTTTTETPTETSPTTTSPTTTTPSETLTTSPVSDNTMIIGALILVIIIVSVSIVLIKKRGR